jgi:hypothetical protein
MGDGAACQLVKLAIGCLHELPSAEEPGHLGYTVDEGKPQQDDDHQVRA